MNLPDADIRHYKSNADTIIQITIAGWQLNHFKLCQIAALNRFSGDFIPILATNYPMPDYAAQIGKESDLWQFYEDRKNMLVFKRISDGKIFYPYSGWQGRRFWVFGAKETYVIYSAGCGFTGAKQ